MAERKIIRLGETDSTNRFLKELALSGAPQGTAVWADSQTAGRGRLGRTFVSPPGVGLYLSYLMRPATPPRETASVTAWAGVAAAEAIKTVTGLTCSVKWVNDLLLQGKKVCGILTEMAGDAVIIGIGINVNTRSFPEEIADKAVSLCLVSGKEVDREQLAEALIRRFDALCRDWPAEKETYLAKYTRLCDTVGKEIDFTCRGIPCRGKAVGIGPDFELTVNLNGQTVQVSSGEVTLHQEGTK